MENQSAAYFVAKGMTVLGMAANALGEAYVFGQVMKAIGRNPKLEETIFTKAIIAAAIVESTAIYSLVAFFMLG